jgi:hypothetical protein
MKIITRLNTMDYLSMELRQEDKPGYTRLFIDVKVTENHK